MERSGGLDAKKYRFVQWGACCIAAAAGGMGSGRRLAARLVLRLEGRA